MAAPAQFATTHPTHLGPFHATAGPRSSTVPPINALPPPVEAFSGRRAIDPGPPNNQRMASCQRVAAANASLSGGRPANAPRSRSAVLPSPGQTTPSVGVPPVLQLHPHNTLPPSLVTGHSGSSSGPSTLSAAAPPDPDMATFSVAMWPFVVRQHSCLAHCQRVTFLQHPSLCTQAGYPRTTFKFTDMAFSKAVEELEHWGLLFTVTVPKSGSVFRSFGEQVVAQLAANDISFRGYDPVRRWRSPHDLPFVLMSSSGRSLRVHTPNDGFNELAFTVQGLLAAKPSLTVISCPIGDEFMKHPFLRLCASHSSLFHVWFVLIPVLVGPRFGDLEARLDNAAARISGASGLGDFDSIRCPGLPHPCFPWRVLSAAIEGLSAQCRDDCPLSSASPSPSLDAVAGPSTRQPLPLPRRGGRGRGRGRGASSAGSSRPPPSVSSTASARSSPASVELRAPAPIAPPQAYVLEEYMLDGRSPSPPTPQSPLSFLRSGCQPSGRVSPLFLPEAQLPTSFGPPSYSASTSTTPSLSLAMSVVSSNQHVRILLLFMLTGVRLRFPRHHTRHLSHALPA